MNTSEHSDTTVYFRAPWVIPVTQSPVKNGVIGIDGEQIVFVGRENRIPADVELRDVDGIIMPGMVNAHTQLELSTFNDAILPGSSFADWMTRTINARNNVSIGEIESAVQFMVHKFHYEGVAAIGDTANNPLVYKFPIFQHVLGRGFLEMMGFHSQLAKEKFKAGLNLLNDYRKNSFLVGLTCHSAYSVSPDLFYLLKNWKHQGENRVLSVHCAENFDEVEFLMTGKGHWRDFLVSIGAWDEQWKIPGKRPVAYLNDLGLLSPDTILVHCIHISKPEIKMIAAKNAHVCWCPTSNFWLKTGRSPIIELLKKDINICLGTDSNAANPVMSMWHEMKEANRQYPELLPETLFEMATINGSRALKIDYLVGSLTPGKLNRAGVLNLPDIPDTKSEIMSCIIDRGLDGEWIWLEDLLE